MKIECTVDISVKELKEMLKKETPVAGTTDENTKAIHKIGLVFSGQETSYRMQEKVEQLVNILKDLSLEDWNKIKNEVDIAYRDVEYKKVPNGELETLKDNLIHKLKL